MEDGRFTIKTVGIAGLGLIGGSFARAIRARTDCRVLGADADTGTLTRARADGVLDGELGASGGCDLLLLALYPQAAIDWLAGHAAAFAPGTVVIDCCGVKRAVAPDLARLAKANGLHYVGGHPMAGTERSGYGASRENLFDRASMILTDAPEPLREPLRAFFLSLGFRQVCWSTPQEHDRVIAYTSQLAHVLSSAYIKSPTAREHFGFSAGSFQDMTRVAYLNETMWTELFLDNADYLTEEIEGLAARLLEYAEAIRGGQRERLRALLAEGRRLKELVEEEKKR